MSALEMCVYYISTSEHQVFEIHVCTPYYAHLIMGNGRTLTIVQTNVIELYIMMVPSFATVPPLLQEGLI